jgi:hypothetical protein
MDVLIVVSERALIIIHYLGNSHLCQEINNYMMLKHRPRARSHGARGVRWSTHDKIMLISRLYRMAPLTRGTEEHEENEPYVVDVSRVE